MKSWDRDFTDGDQSDLSDDDSRTYAGVSDYYYDSLHGTSLENYTPFEDPNVALDLEESS